MNFDPATVLALAYSATVLAFVWWLSGLKTPEETPKSSPKLFPKDRK